MGYWQGFKGKIGLKLGVKSLMLSVSYDLTYWFYSSFSCPTVGLICPITNLILQVNDWYYYSSDITIHNIIIV